MRRFSPARSSLRSRIRATGAATLTIGLVLGCSARGAGTGDPTALSTLADGPPLVRSVTGLHVRAEDGERYDHPWLGGLNVPRPQLIDIDGDRDLDLFVQENSGRVKFFERVDEGDGQWVWRSDRFHDLAVGEWYRFADMDADGDYDLLAEEPFSFIRYYRNDGTPSAPVFTLATDTLLDAAGQPIFADRQNIPNIIDLDCNGRLDLFIGRLTGTVMRYEATTVAAAGDIPRFQLVTDRFENIEIVAQIGSRHGANTMALADIDHDGDPDFFWGDFFEPGVLFIENTGSCQNPVLRGEPLPYPLANPIQTSGYNAPSFGDIDGDGDLDLLVGVLGGAFNPNRTTRENLLFLEQTEPHVFAERTRRLVTNIDVGSESIPVFTDLDGDGDADLLIANKIDPVELQTSVIYRFTNEGTPREPHFVARGSMEMRGLYHYAPAFGDLDGDGDRDMLLGSWRDEVALYRNEGTTTQPRFILGDSALVTITRGSNTTPALVDIDGDGDLDLFVGESSGALNFYRNDGTASAARFVLVSDTFDDIDIGRRSVPTFADLDQDGDQDLIVGSESTGLFVFRNTGTPTQAAFVPDSSWTVEVPAYATPVFTDIDGDGDLDFFTGGIGGGVMFYENRSGPVLSPTR